MTNRFRKWKEKGFTPEEAAAHWNEIHAIASPIMFSRSAFKADHRLLAVAAAHRHLSGLVLRIENRDEWLRYCQHFPVIISELRDHLISRWPECGDVLRDYWPVLAMDEGVAEFEVRAQIGKGVAKEMLMESWEALARILSDRHAMLDLVDQIDPGEFDRKYSWQSTLSSTGIRSLRWSFGDDPGPSDEQWKLMASLREAQDRLRRGVGWQGPILGLSGSTSLALSDNGNSDGVVQPDPSGPGQTMTLSHWSVLAHEWLHTLDTRLARYFGYKKQWATQVMLSWDEESIPPVPMMVWGLQVGMVMGVPPPDKERVEDIQKELRPWDERVERSLGCALTVKEELSRQKRRLQNGSWDMEDACRGWRSVLVVSGAARAERTAYLLASDTQFSLDALSGHTLGTWPEYMERLRAHNQGHSLLGLEGLLRPVEIMARSFEVAIAAKHHRPNGLVWVPSDLRPNAGLLWPLASEAEFQSRGWENTLKALRPLWMEWKRHHGVSDPAGVSSSGVGPPEPSQSSPPSPQ